jgi:hypothetical protein
MIIAINKFYASKRMSLMMALLAWVIFLLSVTDLLPEVFRRDMHGLCSGFLIGLGGFSHLYAENWKRLNPFGKDFFSNAFLVLYGLFVLAFGVVVTNHLIRGLL